REWSEWDNKMRHGHPFFDDWLKSQVLKAAHDVGDALEPVLRTASRGIRWNPAAGYIDGDLVKEPRLYEYDIVFQFVVGDHNADNWPSLRPGEPAAVETVGVRFLRQSLDPPAVPVHDANDDGVFDISGAVYMEAFPSLGLVAQVAIRTGDKRLRKAYL